MTHQEINNLIDHVKTTDDVAGVTNEQVGAILEHLNDEEQELAESVAEAVSAVAAEQGARQAADAALSGRIDSVAGNISTLQGAIDTERTERQGADAALSGRVDTLSGGVTTLQGSLAAEVAERQGADTAIGARIDGVDDSLEVLQGDVASLAELTDVVRFTEVADCAAHPVGWPTAQTTGIDKLSTDIGVHVLWVATKGAFYLYTGGRYYTAWRDSQRFSPLRTHCAYICEADKCVYMWLNGELTPVGKNYDAEIASILERIEDVNHPVEVAQNESTDEVVPDLSVADENGNVLAAFANGHIYTKNFRSDATNHPIDVVNADDAELSIGDESGNDLVRFSGGHIKTKNFNSKSVTKDIAMLKNPDVSLEPTGGEEGEGAELSIGDAEGNDLVRFSGGHIKTKNFNSKAVVKAISDMADADVTVEAVEEGAELSIGDAEGNDVVRFAGGHVKTKNFDSRNVQKSWFAGKTLIVTGDSIPHGQTMDGNVSNPYPNIIANKLGMAVNNYAIGGSTFAQTANFGGAFKDQAAFNAAAKDTTKVYMYMTKDGGHKPSDTPMVYMRYNGSSWVSDGSAFRSPISARYQFMKDADVVLVACGTNDFQYNWTEVGTMFVDNSADEPTEVNLDVHTFYGAVNATIEGLLAKYFGKLIVFATPIKRCQTQSGGNYGHVTSKNTKGLTLKEYGDIIKECCAYYSIPVIDLYSESGLNPHLASQSALFDSYKTHPMQAGHDLLGSLIAAKLLTLKK